MGQLPAGPGPRCPAPSQHVHRRKFNIQDLKTKCGGVMIPPPTNGTYSYVLTGEAQAAGWPHACSVALPSAGSGPVWSPARGVSSAWPMPKGRLQRRARQSPGSRRWHAFLAPCTCSRFLRSCQGKPHREQGWRVQWEWVHPRHGFSRSAWGATTFIALPPSELHCSHADHRRWLWAQPKRVCWWLPSAAQG